MFKYNKIQNQQQKYFFLIIIIFRSFSEEVEEISYHFKQDVELTVAIWLKNGS